MIPMCPCKGCNKRKIGCHARCQDYLGWKAIKDAENKYMYIESVKDVVANTHNRIITDRFIKIKQRERRYGR